MKFKFKIQQYQTEAVEQTVNVFAGQPSKTNAQYRRDLGKTNGRIVYDEEYVGWRNADVELTDKQLLDNIKQMQVDGNIPQSKLLSKPDGLGACSLDIEMETGTGKTYVYIKTMFEMNKRYGWSKFIVVVPSIAIREGVYKSFTMLEEHFMEQYGKKLGEIHADELRRRPRSPHGAVVRGDHAALLSDGREKRVLAGFGLHFAISSSQRCDTRRRLPPRAGSRRASGR